MASHANTMPGDAVDQPATAGSEPSAGSAEWDDALAAARYLLASAVGTAGPTGPDTSARALLACLTEYRERLATLVAAAPRMPAFTSGQHGGGIMRAVPPVQEAP